MSNPPTGEPDVCHRSRSSCPCSCRHPLARSLDAYLHERTSGLIGSLSQLVREAAIEAIDSGAERITKRLLDSVELDHTVEQARTKKTPKKRTRRTKAA
ncbi:hypothetical protein [Streptomyces sp. LN549]|uniref:hypothetical protein n=1 Tax=Streptomyces sp. LN549 TaxID=3112979 RepID=UPI003720B048